MGRLDIQPADVTQFENTSKDFIIPRLLKERLQVWCGFKAENLFCAWTAIESRLLEMLLLQIDLDHTKFFVFFSPLQTFSLFFFPYFFPITSSLLFYLQTNKFSKHFAVCQFHFCFNNGMWRQWGKSFFNTESLTLKNQECLPSLFLSA